MTFGPLHLMRPEWLWALLPAALLALALVRARRRAGSWSAVISPSLLPYLIGEQGETRRRNALPWILVAWVVAVLALCGPSLRKIPQPVQQREDALVVVLDLSYSMKAADLAPSRMDRARQKIVDLLDRREEGQTALVAFAGDAHVVTPLTDDNPTIANLLPALNPDMMPVPGSDAAGGVDMALDLLRSGGAGHGRILLVTDGVDSGQRQRIAEAVRESGAGLIVMGAGTRNGAPLPLPGGGFLKDASGTIVIPTLDDSALQQLASDAGGRYLPLRIDAGDLDALTSRTALPGQERLSAVERRADHWEDQGYLLVLLLLPAALLLFRRGNLAALLLVPLLLGGGPRPATAQESPTAEKQVAGSQVNPPSWAARQWDNLWLTPDQQGQRALQNGDSQRARQLFDNPAWAGTAAYRGGNYDAAAQQFAQGQSADDWYNRGNALARAGDLDGAIAAYRKSLEKSPEREDASDNLALVEQLKKQQEKQQQQNQQQSEDDNSENQQQNQKQDQQQNQQSGDGDGRDQQQQPQPDSQQQEQQGDQPQDQPSQQDGAEGDQRDQGANPSQPGQQEPQQQPPSSEAGQQTADQPADGEREQRNARAAQSPEEAERDQAMQQWLRRIPDDPSGLLREKFRYESRQRQQQGEAPNDDTNW